MNTSNIQDQNTTKTCDIWQTLMSRTVQLVAMCVDHGHHAQVQPVAMRVDHGHHAQPATPTAADSHAHCGH